MSEHKESPNIQHAWDLIKSVHGKHLTLQQREDHAVELTSHMLKEARKQETFSEKRASAELARMMLDPRGKAFTTAMADQCFRSHRSSRVANQLIYLLQQFGIPKYLSPFKRMQLAAFQTLGQPLSFIMVPLAAHALRKAASRVILPGERRALSHHMHERRKEGVHLNLNHLGEAILSEEEAERRLDKYLEDLRQDDIECVSIKISTIYSQINLLAWQKTLEILAHRLRQLYKMAMTHHFKRADGEAVPKFVYLDMEEYKDLHLTKELFKKVLSDHEFLHFSAGIVLQAYIPDSFEIQKELTHFAMERMARGGAPIKIRIVKGANLAMEQFEASLKGWPQAPYTHKTDTDANYKRMVTYGCMPEHAKAVHLGIASHNLFDVSYAMIIREEQHVAVDISFEMLEGMADPMRRVVQRLTKDMLLYCPVATKKDFQNAVAYLVRRLDENTGKDNFLRHIFGLKPGTEDWDAQVNLFRHACEEMHKVSYKPRRTQNRNVPPQAHLLDAPFDNEPDTDFSLPQNQKWADHILREWNRRKFDPIPLVIGGKVTHSNHSVKGHDPSYPNETLYTYALADWTQIDEALRSAKSHEASWAAVPLKERCDLLANAAQKLREWRADLNGVMMADGGKTLVEADPEVSEAIDFAEYYRRSLLKMDACKDIKWRPKGTILVAPPWNFPISIPAGGILAGLAAGNCVLFKPAPEAVLSGWILIQALWEAGIPKEVLQFINCADDPVGSKLIADPRLSAVILTGATSTARLFKKLNPALDLAAETGGKNTFIITSLADRDLAIKDLIHSAFGHSGQKCSAASLLILEAEVYDDPHFRKQLREAVESITVGTQWDPSTKVNPLIRLPGEDLLRGLTTLDEGEKWLVHPKQNAHNPNLWSPGVKWGVQAGSFMHQTELFGPVIGVMRAKNLEHAIELANGTPYGLTAGIHTLDEREQRIWIDKIQAGNCYVNRGTTGAIVRRQPFGGCKASSFGPGAKAGGPNYVAQFAIPTQVSLPPEKYPIDERVNQLISLIDKLELSTDELGLWYGSIANYAYWGKRFKQDHDPSKIVGQDNIFRYRPRTGVCLRLQKNDRALDIMRTLAAALTADIKLDVSWTPHHSPLEIHKNWHEIMPHFSFIEETREQFCRRLEQKAYERVRMLTQPAETIMQAASLGAIYIAHNPVLANGRFELLHYLREVSLSIDYHRYGNLGIREGELRKPIL